MDLCVDNAKQFCCSVGDTNGIKTVKFVSLWNAKQSMGVMASGHGGNRQEKNKIIVKLLNVLILKIQGFGLHGGHFRL